MNETHPLFARRLSRHQLIALDLVAGLGFSLVFLTATAQADGLPPWARLAFPLGLGLPLALRRLWPFPVFCFLLALSIAAVMADLVSFAYVSPAYALYVVALADGARGTWVPTSAIAVLTLVTGVGLVAVGGSPRAGAPEWMFSLDKPLIGIAALGGAWTVGRAVRERRIYAARDAERLAGQAVTEERLRIARELHDVVTHSVGLIAVKAGVANHVMKARPDEARDALRVIETVSRGALVEMRHLLGVLRSAEAPEFSPTPGIADLRALAERASLAGVEVELDVRIQGVRSGCEPADTGAGEESADRDGARPGGAQWADRTEGAWRGDAQWADAEGARWGDEVDGMRLPDGVELSVYRIVQEALTNVVKHAAPARCRASVVADEREVRIEVVDDGPGRRTLPADGAGHGLIGMRERVMMYGGAFEAGRVPGQGFRVSARLPYGDAP
ncbi:histidine kinase [Nonomuraea sp. NPDC005983]|uniref:sensor histidine kinase n=1 Tax=Nonomuraea sp. NPDC005983 TaxID=3155595 RepID=UPI0033B9778C